jgi:hypothetical protein
MIHLRMVAVVRRSSGLFVLGMVHLPVVDCVRGASVLRGGWWGCVLRMVLGNSDVREEQRHSRTGKQKSFHV